MPDRILRSDLLTSEAWLSLKNNDDRACWIALFLNADTLGNQPAGPLRLVHIWRPYGIDLPEKAAKVLAELHDVDLARPYEHDGKPYVHIPRFRSSQRYLCRLYPLSPWTTDEEKQRISKKSPANRSESQARTGESPSAEGIPTKTKDYEKVACDSPLGVGLGVGVGVGVGEVQKQRQNLKVKSPVVAGSRLSPDWQLPEPWQAWAEHLTGWDEQKVLRESLVFRDYWHSKAGAGSRKVDWLATWRNWIRRASQ